MVRLDIAKKGGLMNHNSAVPMDILWQGPQYFFIGVAEVFTVVGFIEFAYEQSPDAMRSLCQACSLIMITLRNLQTLVFAVLPLDPHFIGTDGPTVSFIGSGKFTSDQYLQF